MKDKKPNVIIYGAGQFGQAVARIILDKDVNLVGAYNRAGDKVGQDIATLAGLGEPIGIKVQDSDATDFTAIDADVAIVVMTDYLEKNIAAYRRLLNAGMNVICHGTESYYPYGQDKALAGEINNLAIANNVTFTGTGIWDMSRIWAGMMVSAPCTHINSFFHRSITDAERLGEKLMRVCGVGKTVEDFDKVNSVIPRPISGLYKTIPAQVLTASGYTVTKVTDRTEPVILDTPFYSKVLGEELAAGICVGTRMIIQAQTAEGPTAEAHIELRVFQEGETEHMMWEVDGLPSSKITVERDDSVYASAATIFNRIGDVINAPAGIQVVSELDMLRHSALR